MGGGVAEDLAAQMQRDGVEPPEVVSKQPVLQAGLVMYLDAFYELDSERSHQMALTRIPWSSIVAFAKENDYDREETLFFIRKMDDAHLDRLRRSNSGGTGGPGEVVHRPPRPDS